MRKLTRGYLVVIEGIDGTGKTTLASNLQQLCAEDHIDSLLTYQPGATALGKSLRNLLHQKKITITSKAEYLLFAADRAQHMEEIVIPALDKHQLVISDRMGDSSIAYQGYGRGLSLDMITSINTWAMNSIVADLILYLQVPPEQAIRRFTERHEALTSFEQEKIDFFKRVMQGFETIYKERKNVIYLDGTLPAQELAHKAYTALRTYLIQHEKFFSNHEAPRI